MTTRLTSTGIRFPDNSVLNSKYGIIPKDSFTFFHQASAPTFWERITTHNNKSLRVVDGVNIAGGGSGGTQPFTTVFNNQPYSSSGSFSVSIGAHTLTTAQLPSHNHTGGGTTLNAVPASFNPDGSFAGWNGGDVGRSGGWNRFGGGDSGAQGGGGSHSHPAAAGSYSVSGSIDLRITYIDVILCKFL